MNQKASTMWPPISLNRDNHSWPHVDIDSYRATSRGHWSYREGRSGVVPSVQELDHLGNHGFIHPWVNPWRKGSYLFGLGFEVVGVSSTKFEFILFPLDGFCGSSHTLMG